MSFRYHSRLPSADAPATRIFSCPITSVGSSALMCPACSKRQTCSVVGLHGDARTGTPQRSSLLSSMTESTPLGSWRGRSRPMSNAAGSDARSRRPYHHGQSPQPQNQGGLRDFASDIVCLGTRGNRTHSPLEERVEANLARGSPLTAIRP